jgi:hypothetical protein
MPEHPKPAPENSYLIEHVRLLRNSYSDLLGRPLAPADFDDEQAAAYLFLAPMVLLSHNTDADPIFNYANRTGLDLFELTWDELIELPSRRSAEAINRKERQKVLDQVSDQGYIDNYQCVRITKSGKRFDVKNATVWSLYDAQNCYQGQAACFSEWTFID